MSESNELPAVDQPPKSGVFVDPDDTPLSDAEIAAGNALGAAIDIDDDEDAG